MVIFDLDLTLVDSRCVLELQRKRRWRTVFSMVPEIEPYDGISELLARLHGARVPAAIVTSSPDQYCRKIVEYHGWNIGNIIGFHDVRNRKPHPDPINLALQRMGVPSATPSAQAIARTIPRRLGQPACSPSARHGAALNRRRLRNRRRISCVTRSPS